MNYLYLRCRNSTSDPWTEVPSLTTSFPGAASGSMPVLHASIETGPLIETRGGYSDPTASDAYAVLRAQCPPIPSTLEDTLLLFLLAFKAASFHEIKMQHFGAGHYVSSTLSQLECVESAGMLRLSFRLAATVADALV